MIPRTIMALTLTGTPAMEVFGYITTEITEQYVKGVATVTLPGSGRWGTVEVVTYDGMDYLPISESALEAPYAGMRDAERRMFERAGLDNHATIVSSQGTPTARHPNAYTHIQH